MLWDNPDDRCVSERERESGNKSSELIFRLMPDILYMLTTVSTSLQNVDSQVRTYSYTVPMSVAGK